MPKEEARSVPGFARGDEAVRAARVILLLLAACTGIGASIPARADWFGNDCGPPDARTAGALRRFEDNIEQSGRSGIVVGVVRGTCLLFKRGFGFADAERRIAMRPETLSRIGSVTKTVTAVLMLRLVEEGTVALDDPVVRHLPQFARVRGRGVEQVTLRQLASHTGGLPVKARGATYGVGPFEQWQSLALRALQSARLVLRPGRRYRYSNLGTVALGLALGRAAGRPYVELVKEKVLEPLGMQNTTFYLAPELRRAPLLALSSSGAREHDGLGSRIPSGGLYSTVEDLGRFAAALYGAGPPGFLSEHSRRLLATPALDDSKYGLGVRLGRLGGSRTLKHAGAISGYRAALLVAPDAQTGAIVLQSAGNGRPTPMVLAHRLLAPLLWRPSTHGEKGVRRKSAK